MRFKKDWQDRTSLSLLLGDWMSEEAKSSPQMDEAVTAVELS